jgi:hypothetical protein
MSDHGEFAGDAWHRPYGSKWIENSLSFQLIEWFCDSIPQVE